MPDQKTMAFAASVIADTFIKKAKGSAIGAIGVYLPKFDAQELADRLGKSMDGKKVRLALLGVRNGIRPRKNVQVTTSVTEANKWRNEAAAPGNRAPRLFVASNGMGEKETSLLSALEPVCESDLRKTLATRIAALSDSAHKAFWMVLQRAVDEFTLESMLELGAECEEVVGRSGTLDLIDVETKALWKLGLLPDARVFESDGEKFVERCIRQNLDLVRRLGDLSTKDRQAIMRVLERGDDQASYLVSAAQKMLAYDKSAKGKLRELDYKLVLEVLGFKGSGAKPPKAKKPKESVLGDEAVVDDILVNDGENIKSITKAFEADDNDDGGEEVSTQSQKFVPKKRTGTSVIATAVDRLITAKRFGGIVLTDEATNYIDCLKQVGEGEVNGTTPFEPNSDTDKYSVAGILKRTVDHYGEALEKDVLGLWESYQLAREEVLSYATDLCDHPLLSMLGSKDVLEACEKLIVVYGAMVDGVAYVRDTIRQRDPNVAKFLMSRTMALDVIFLRFSNEAVAIAGPTHPFHLWRWTEIAKMLKDKEIVGELKEVGEEVIQKHAANPPVASPHIILNTFVDDRFINDADRRKDYVFTGIGAIGALPLYGDSESRLVAKFRVGEIGEIAAAFSRLAPYANFGFEAVAIDPPSVAELLDSLTKVNQGRNRSELVPIHLRVFRTREIPSSTDEEDSMIEELAAIIRQTKGSFEIESQRLTLKAVCAKLEQRPAHYTMVFEPGEATSFKVGLTTSPSLSPLIVPRSYNYAPLEDQFDVVIHGDATPFGSYYELFCELTSTPQGNTIGRRSGASRWIPDLGEIGAHTMWLSVIDQGIEATFKIPDAIRLDKRNVGGGGRDIQTFTSHRYTIMRHIEKLVTSAGLVPDNEATVERTFKLIRTLGGDTVPIVFSQMSDSGSMAQSHARGLMGVLAVTDWYQKNASDALLISLDSKEGRAWLFGAHDENNFRGDLIAIRQGREGLCLEAIEVKVREDEKSVLNFSGSGGETVIGGHAVDQVDSTIKVLKRIMAPEGLGKVDKARREVLRDHLYMAIANRESNSSARERAVKMLDQFFDHGAETVKGRVFVVHVEHDAQSDYPPHPKRFGVSPAGNPIETYELTESEVPFVFESKSVEPEPPGPTPPVTKSEKTKAKPAPEPGQKSKREKIEPEPAKTTLPDSVSVFIGRTPSGEDVVWNTDINVTPNFGFLITGDPGSGKTQTIRAIMQEVRDLGYPVMVFDFKNDYSDPEISERLKLTVYDVVQQGLPFNPLSLIPDEHGNVHPIRQCYDFANIIARVEGLKEQQTSRLVEAQRRAYEAHGLPARERIPYSEIKSEPVFDEVLANLVADGDRVSDTVVFRLRRFSDLGLFPQEATKDSFGDLLKDGVVLTLNDSANDKLMTILAEIMIVKIHATVKRGDQPRVLRRLLVFDEAWRIANSMRLVELGREGRAFGVGMVIGTQNPMDMPDTLMNSCATKLFLYNNNPENHKVVLRNLCPAISTPDAQKRLKVLSQLSTFQGHIINPQYSGGVRVNVVPHKDRI